MAKKDCSSGTIYIINGKKWCVGEKKISKKYGTKKSKKGSLTKSKKSKK